MSGLSTLNVVTGALSFVLVLTWAHLARAAWRRVRARGTTFSLLGASVTSTLTVIYFWSTLFAVIPSEVHDDPPPLLGALYGVNDVAAVIAVALFHHWTCFFTLRRTPATWGWLAANYGSAALVMVLALVLRTLAGRGHALAFVALQIGLWSYLLVMLGLSTRRIAALARRQRWRPGGSTVAGLPDVVVLALGVACVTVVIALHASGSWTVHRESLDVLPVVLGFVLVLPFAVRELGGVLASVAGNLATLGVAAAVLYGVWLLDRRLADPALRPVTVFLAAIGLVVAFGPVHGAVTTALEWLVLRRSRHRWLHLQSFLRELSPELGAAECARRAVERLAEVMHLRGAAFVSRDGEGIAAGVVALGPIVERWTRGNTADALVKHTAIQDDLAALPAELREALIEADVVALVPVRGAHRLWGHLLLVTDLMGTTFEEDELQSIETYADQLARILDGADMLARVVAVERSLAHADKLAAIGELTARVAHELRNPVTAARSLAQQLVRDAGGAGTDQELVELILASLDRVERHVAELLRFARRDELKPAPTDVREIVRQTVAGLRSRLEQAEVHVTVEAPAPAVASVDGEKLRQVLVNLLENARDALGEWPGERSVAISVGNSDGRVHLCVRDSGPGVAPDELERLFEPFFTSKPHGTGLGLAIVKRIVDAHGGAIHAQLAPGGGLSFEIDLPVGAQK